MDELKELRDQMAAMRSDLNNYAIVNDRLMQTVMRQRSKSLNWFVNAELIVTPFLILFFFGICYILHMSMWLAITMSVACIISGIIDLKTMRVSSKLINSLSLRDLRSYLIRQKRQRTIQMIIELPLCMAWLVWFMLDYFSNEVMFADLQESAIFQWVKIIAIAITAIIAIIVIAVIFKKSQRVNDTMIEDIDLQTCDDEAIDSTFTS